MKKTLLLIFASVLAYCLSVLKGFRMGQKSEQDKKNQEDFQALKTRLDVEQEVNNLSESETRKKLSKWVKDESAD